jgi:hypothetical protein
MSLYFVVKFEDVSPDEFYKTISRDDVDSRFKSRVKNALDEECTVIQVFSESAQPPYAVFEGKFEATDKELYQKFGTDGMAKAIKNVAEKIYGRKVSKVTMEKRY